MKNNLKKAYGKFWLDLLYFQHFLQIFSSPQIRDYHHLKMVIITDLGQRVKVVIITDLGQRQNLHFIGGDNH